MHTVGPICICALPSPFRAVSRVLHDCEPHDICDVDAPIWPCILHKFVFFVKYFDKKKELYAKHAAARTHIYNINTPVGPVTSTCCFAVPNYVI